MNTHAKRAPFHNGMVEPKLTPRLTPAMTDLAQPPTPGEEKYWAFISYSHRDRAWGEWLHRKLETFRVPKRLVGTLTPRGVVPARLFPTFRDREELPVSADLGRNIDEALRLSRYLIVICSPAAAKSRWVNEEILNFKRLGRSDRILTLIVEGEPNASEGKPGFAVEDECFPEAVRFALGEDGKLGTIHTEPIAADVRPGQDGKENSFLKLVAGIIGVNFDDLRQREHERKVRRLEVVIAAAMVLLLLFAVLGVALYFQRNYARSQKNRAEAALEEVRQTLSRSDYLQAVEAVGKEASPEALAFLSRAVRTNPRNAAATELLLSSLTDRTWLLPAANPLALGEEVGIAVFDRKGDALFVSDGMNEWRVLDASTGAVRTRGKVPQERIGRAAFSPDGKRIAVSCGPVETNVVQVWDVPGGTVVAGPIAVKGAVMGLGFRPDGKTFLTASGNVVEEFDTETGAPARPAIDHGNPVMCAEFAPDATGIISAALFDTFFWNAETRQADGEPVKHDAIPQSFALSPAGDKLAIALGDSTGRIFSLPDRTPLGVPLPHRSDITEVRFSANGQVLLTSSNDRTAMLWDASSGGRLVEPMRHEKPVIAAAFNPAQDAILTVSGGLGKPAQLDRWSLQRPTPPRASLNHGARVLAFNFSPDGRRVVAGSVDGRATVWDALKPAVIGAPLAHENELAACVFSPDGTTIATAAGPLAILWEAGTGRAKVAPLKHDGAVTAVSFSPDGRQLLTASLDKTARLWKSSDGSPAGAPLRHEDGVVAAEFSPVGGRLLTGSNDGTARLWNADTGQSLAEPLRHGGAVTVAHFSPNGRRIVTGAKDATARVWDAHTGRPVTPPLRHDREITEALFSADSTTLVTAAGEFGGQGSARVWDAETGQPLTDPMLHPDGVTSAALHPDGDRLVTGAFDGMLRVWDLRTGKPRSLPMRFGEPIVRVQFSTRSPQLAVASGEVVALLELADPRPSAPDWLALLAERVGGLRFDAQGLLEPVPEHSIEDLARQLRAHEPRNGYERFGRWFLGDTSPAAPNP